VLDAAGYKSIDVYKPPPSRHTNGHRRSHTPVCMLVTSTASTSTGVIVAQHLLPKTLSCCTTQREWPASLTDESRAQSADSSKAYRKPSRAFNCFSHRWSIDTKPNLVFLSVGHVNRLPERRVVEKFPRSQDRPSLITPARLKIPAYSDPVKRWNFGKADWNRFSFDMRIRGEVATSGHNKYREGIPGTMQLFVAKSISRGRRKNYVPCWDKEYVTLSASLRPYFHNSTRRGRNDRKKRSDPSTSRTPAAMREAPSTNLLAGPETPPVCAASRRNPSLHNS